MSGDPEYTPGILFKLPMLARDSGEVCLYPSGRRFTLSPGDRSRWPLKAEGSRWPDLTKMASNERIGEPTYEELVRATYDQNKELADYTGSNLIIIEGEGVCLSPRGKS